MHEALNEMTDLDFLYFQNVFYRTHTADLGHLHVFLTQGRQGWQAAARQPALHCRRAGLGP